MRTNARSGVFQSVFLSQGPKKHQTHTKDEREQSNTRPKPECSTVPLNSCVALLVNLHLDRARKAEADAIAIQQQNAHKRRSNSLLATAYGVARNDGGGGED